MYYKHREACNKVVQGDEQNKLLINSLEATISMNEKQRLSERQRDLAKVGAISNRIDGFNNKVDEAFEGLENLREMN